MREGQSVKKNLKLFISNMRDGVLCYIEWPQKASFQK